MTPHIAHWIWNLGIGGDAKNACSLAAAQTSWAKVSILTQAAEPGDRAKNLTADSIRVSGAIDTDERLRLWIDEAKPSLFLFHRSGRQHPLETSLVRAASSLSIPCFEYNTFGRVDESTDQLWTGHCHLSRTSLMRYAQRRHWSPLNTPGHAAIGYPVNFAEIIQPEERRAAREALRIDSQAFVILRLLRPDLRKWDATPVLAVHRLLAAQPPVHLLLMSAPDSRKNWIRRNCGPSVTLLDPSVSESNVRQALAASNCLVNFSNIGETFGLALAEAMASGLPALVNSTPRMDNAQIELCRHQSTGLVANTISSLAASIRYLQANPAKAEQFGLAGRSFIQTNFAGNIVEARLRNFLIDRLKATGSNLVSSIPLPQASGDAYELNQEWLDEYEKRLGQSFHKTGSALQEFADRQLMNAIRLLDTLEYAYSVGPNRVLHAVSERIRHGALDR